MRGKPMMKKMPKGHGPEMMDKSKARKATRAAVRAKKGRKK